ncbi:hypothetical protein [Psychroflexus sp. ALD_RP9]|uniref:hypothetical protein n=1 Tax=Psychroflexus sp. ALD_RP9 TaxID=2777186 RepID=UPI001A90AE73|nr:hypothetical protein [Psychroflexus sp. ALD_RP9]QSS96909.1 hypothetical protein IMZ30_10730 [Psychroflexus sp. ALD_RP9]
MKNYTIILLISSFLILVNCKSRLINKTEETIGKINKQSVLIDQFKKNGRNDAFMKSKLYNYQNFEILEAEFFGDTLMRTQMKIYMKDSLMIKFEHYGLRGSDARLGKEKPYAKVFSEIYYFESPRKGILKYKEIKIKNFSAFKKAKSDLDKIKFEITEVNQNDYEMVLRNYVDLIQLHNKTN